MPLNRPCATTMQAPGATTSSAARVRCARARAKARRTATGACRSRSHRKALPHRPRRRPPRRSSHCLQRQGWLHSRPRQCARPWVRVQRVAPPPLPSPPLGQPAGPPSPALLQTQQRRHHPATKNLEPPQPREERILAWRPRCQLCVAAAVPPLQAALLTPPALPGVAESRRRRHTTRRRRRGRSKAAAACRPHPQHHRVPPARQERAVHSPARAPAQVPAAWTAKAAETETANFMPY